MKVLILGARGFIGSNILNRLLLHGCEVIGCDLVDYTTTQYTYYKLSIDNPDFKSLFTKNVDICINAAGSGNVGLSLINPLSDFMSNTFSVVEVLDAIRSSQPNCKYLHISSAAVYGNPQILPISENHPLNPLSPYGFHKWMSELVCQEYSLIYGLSIIIIRPFSVYGNGLKKQLLWDICNRIEKEKTITLFGTGNETRDFIHISDLVEIISTISLKESFEYKVFNIGSSIETKIKEIAKIFEENHPSNPVFKFSGETKKGDPSNWCADTSKLNKFNFQPKVDIRTGIINYIDWFLNHEK